MTYLAIIGLTAPLAHMVTEGMHMPRVKYMKVGGLRFLRIGRLQLSFCVCRQSL